MRVHLLVGDGWNPFVPRPGDDAALVEIDGGERLDLPGSARRLAEVLVGLVHEEYPDATVEVLPPDPDDGQVVLVLFEPGDAERFEDLTGTAPAAVDDPEQEGPALVREAIYVLLGEALETPGWRVERP